MLWRLEGLKALSAEDQRRAYEEVGGHPRALEYLDAILRGGKARFPEVQALLRRQFAAEGVTDPASWCAAIEGGLAAKLAATVTLAANDVLLDQLLSQLDDAPLAQRLLIAASVYRVPVDDIGLIWTVGEPVELPPDSARADRLQDAQERLAAARKEDPTAGLDDVAHSPGELQQWVDDFREENRPPVGARMALP